MRDPIETHESKVRSRSPYLLWLVWVVWLPFLIPPIWGLVQSHPPLLHLIVILIGVVLFAGLYLWATWRNVQHRLGPSSLSGYVEASTWLVIVCFSALSITLALLVHESGNGTEMLEPFIFTSAYVTGRLPTFRAAQVLVALALLTVIVGRLIGLSWFELGQGVVYVSVVGVVTIGLVRSVTTGRELHAAREEIARLAVMNERLRIARDLHDLLGHNLSLIALKSELAGRLIGLAPERAAVEVYDIENVARTTLQEVREAVASYRQPTLASELHAAQEILAAAGIAYRSESDESMLDTIPPAIEAVLSWTVREGVTNVIRHSRARQCTICVTRDVQNVHVEITDDGISTPKVTAKQSPVVASNGVNGNGGNGLRGLAERVMTLGGSYEAGPRAGGGFHLAVSVPLAQRNQNAGASPGAALDTKQAPVAPLERSDLHNGEE